MEKRNQDDGDVSATVLSLIEAFQSPDTSSDIKKNDLNSEEIVAVMRELNNTDFIETEFKSFLKITDILIEPSAKFGWLWFRWLVIISLI